MSLAVRLAGVGLGRGNPVPAINLRFTEGVVDPRITFTRATTATYTNSSGSIASAAIDAPRIDYGPVTLACKGLLIEEARTNLLTYSEQFDNAAWTADGSTVTANATTSPDGTATADNINSTGANWRVTRNLTTASSTSYTFSCFIKKNSSTLVRLEVDSTGGADPTTFFGVQFNLDTGASTSVASGTPTNIAMVAYPNGWYRCSFTYLTSSTHNASFVYLYGGGAYGSAGQTYYWGAQLEAGSFATSYIPTAASQVTRAADVAVMTGSNFSSWYNQSEGTFVVELEYAGQSAAAQVGFGTSDGTFNNSVYDSRGAGTANCALAMISGGASQVTTASFVCTSAVPFKHALAYKVNDYAESYNGAAVQTDSSVTLSTQSQLVLGSASWSAGAANMCGHIKRITYWNSRLPNATLVALSA